MLRLTKISKSYRDIKVLDNLDLTIAKGEYHVILGKSGGGKSTLLRIAAGLEMPDKGCVLIQDKIKSKNSCGIKRGIGMLMQNDSLFPHITIIENVIWALKAGKIDYSKKKIQNLLNIMGIETIQNKLPAQCSGGQRQRAALARVLAARPKIVLLDEPLSSIDPITAFDLRKFLKSIQQKTGVTFLHITHNRKEAAELAERISILGNGTILQTGTAEDLFLHPTSSQVAALLGAKNTISCKVKQLNGSFFVTPFFKEAPCLELPLYPHIVESKGNIDLWIHPGHIQLYTKPESKTNCYKGRVRSSLFNGIRELTEVTIGSTILTIENQPMNLKPGTIIWVYLPKDKLRPLCRQIHRNPTSKANCIKNLRK